MYHAIAHRLKSVQRVRIRIRGEVGVRVDCGLKSIHIARIRGEVVLGLWLGLC